MAKAAKIRGRCGGDRGSAPGNSKKRKRKETLLLHDVLLSPEHIMAKVFRKDGPPLGVDFDSLPSNAFHRSGRVSRIKDSVFQENQGLPKRTKVVRPAVLDSRPFSNNSAPVKKCGMGKGLMHNNSALVKKHGMGNGPMNNSMPLVKKHGIGKGLMNSSGAPVKKHGIGKGLMTAWRVLNPGAGIFPTGVDFVGRGANDTSHISTSKAKKPPNRVNTSRQQKIQMRRAGRKLEDKNKSFMNKRKGEHDRGKNHQIPCKEKCELALVGVGSEEGLDLCSELQDDEELELWELQAGPNPLTCSAHFSTKGRHCCPLCKDLLAKFPPDTVKMKEPFSMKPWDSSPELVKKLFKVFHFLYSYAVAIDIPQFTLDEFVEAFHDKDSGLLGKVHVALLKFLLSIVEMELSNECVSRVSKSFLFLGLLQSVERQEFVVKLWQKFLNPLTWTEILRQVLVAAGFGSKEGTLQRQFLNKEVDLIAKYGLHPGTLKTALFSILSEQGDCGLKVSELAKSLQILDLNLASTSDELELLISSTLASDITLFEKISSSAYRLRSNSMKKEAESVPSDTEDSGSIDDDSDNCGACSSDSECDSLAANVSKNESTSKSKNIMSLIYTEIDESHPGEVWLLGLMDGEYGDLRIEEKVEVIMALVDLLSSASNILVESPKKDAAEYPHNVHVGSGAKIKRPSSKEFNFSMPSWDLVPQIPVTIVQPPSEIRPVDSSALASKLLMKEKSFCAREYNEHGLEVEADSHPMQSTFLGSDRRYNRYWLFLGPCNTKDPGHRRVYFESSEDGHWEVIDNEEGLCSLLLALDTRGKREAHLFNSLKTRKTFICQAMSSRRAINDGDMQLSQSDQSGIDMIREDNSPISEVDSVCLTGITNNFSILSGTTVIDVVKKEEEEKQKYNRLQAFDAWIWNTFYCDLSVIKHGKRSYRDSLMRCESCHDLYWRDEKHCKTCHITFELDFDLEERYTIHAATCRARESNKFHVHHKVLSSQLQSLKAATYAIESGMPRDALVGSWTESAHNLWIKRLRRTSSLAELLQVLADFVGAISEDWLCQSSTVFGSGSVLEDTIACFTTIPQTSSAVALWLVKLDALIAPHLEAGPLKKAREPSSRSRGKQLVVK